MAAEIFLTTRQVSKNEVSIPIFLEVSPKTFSTFLTLRFKSARVFSALPTFLKVSAEIFSSLDRLREVSAVAFSTCGTKTTET